MSLPSLLHYYNITLLHGRGVERFLALILSPRGATGFAQEAQNGRDDKFIDDGRKALRWAENGRFEAVCVEGRLLPCRSSRLLMFAFVRNIKKMFNPLNNIKNIFRIFAQKELFIR